MRRLIPLLALLMSGCMHAQTPPAQSAAPADKPGAAAVKILQASQDESLAQASSACVVGRELWGQAPVDSYSKVRARWHYLNCLYAAAPKRKLLVLLDGTANDQGSNTNIWRMYDLALKQAEGGAAVIPYYDKGVGTDPLSLMSGNLFGSGVSLNIRQAYRFLAQAYQPGDEIYLFGFSRGALTARSLNGFIEFAGLADFATVRPDAYDEIPGLRWLGNFHRRVAGLYDIYFSRHSGAADFEAELRKALDTYKTEHGIGSRAVQVSAIGVFDSVAAIGYARDEEPDDHRLDLYARRGYHALSLDEQREEFRLLRFYTPLRKGQKLEEVWFAGVHADVGGGYNEPSGCAQAASGEGPAVGLEATPLNWMLDSFAADRIFASSPRPAECPNGRLHDELIAKGVLGGLYRWLGMMRRHPVTGDKVHGSVACRMSLNLPQGLNHPLREPRGRYQPQNLGEEPQSLFRFLPYPCPGHTPFATTPGQSQ